MATLYIDLIREAKMDKKEIERCIDQLRDIDDKIWEIKGKIAKVRLDVEAVKDRLILQNGRSDE